MDDCKRNREIDELIKKVEKQIAVLYMTDVALTENDSVIDTESVIIIVGSAWQELKEVNTRLSKLLPENYYE